MEFYFHGYVFLFMFYSSMRSEIMSSGYSFVKWDMISEQKSLACAGANRWKLFAAFAYYFCFLA